MSAAQERCLVCGQPLDPYKGEVFVGKDGETYCNDHYPDRIEGG